MLDIESRFEGLRRSAACAQLSRDQTSELIGITAQLIDERRRIQRILISLPENFAEVRKQLNELTRVIK